MIIGGWLTNTQFLDAIAIGAVLPAPLVIITTFIGYVGGGFLGAILMTLGMVPSSTPAIPMLVVNLILQVHSCVCYNPDWI